MQNPYNPTKRPLPQGSIKQYAAAALFAFVVIVYLSGTRGWWSGDTLPTAYLPISILEHGTLYLDYYPSLYNTKAEKDFPHGHGPLPYYISFSNGHYVSSYSPWPAMLSVPVYAVPLLTGALDSPKSIMQWAKISASIITALSVVFLFLALCELVSIGWATVIALIYAVGTSAFSVSSQALYEHGPSTLFLTLGLLFLVKGLKNESRLPFAGLCFSVAVLMRYTDALIALVIAFYIIHKHRRLLPRYLMLSALPAFLLLAYNHWYLGSVGDTGYFTWSARGLGRNWRTPFWMGLSGLLFSPSRGLLVYTPIVLLSFAGIWLIWRKGPIAFRYLAVGPFLVILVCSKWYMWWGGYGYGPRLLADVAPLFCFFLYPLGSLIEKRRSLLLGFVFLAVLSFGMHAVGAYWYDARWDTQESVWKDPGRLWSWSGSPFVYYGRYPYWDLGQVAEWIGLRDDIHLFFQHLRGLYHRSPGASHAHLRHPSKVMMIATSLRAAYPAMNEHPYTRGWERAASTTRSRILG